MTIQTSAADDSRSGKKNVGAILFACNINAVRSAMAEAMVKVTFQKKIFLNHAGNRKAHVLNPITGMGPRFPLLP